jgi:hypothetical protein
MKWRKEPNNYPFSKLRKQLNAEELDIYHCLRAIAGDNNGRQGYVERCTADPYSAEELAILWAVSPTDITNTMDGLKKLGIIEYDDNRVVHFVDWEIEQAIPPSRKKGKYSQQEQEAYDKWQQQRLNKAYPEAVNIEIQKALVSLGEQGLITTKGAHKDVRV